MLWEIAATISFSGRKYQNDLTPGCSRIKEAIVFKNTILHFFIAKTM